MNIARSRKYLVPFLLANFVIYSSCHKSSSRPNPKSSYYLHCTIDGVDLKFDSGLTAFKHSYTAPGSGDNYIAVSGLTGMSLGKELEFTIENTTSTINNIGPLPVGVGSYGVNSPDFHIDMTYDSLGQNSYVADATGEAPDTSNFFTINITAIDSATVKGTFSGKVYIDNNSAGSPPVQYGPQYKTITNGTFYAGLDQ